MKMFAVSKVADNRVSILNKGRYFPFATMLRPAFGPTGMHSGYRGLFPRNVKLTTHLHLVRMYTSAPVQRLHAMVRKAQGQL